MNVSNGHDRARGGVTGVLVINVGTPDSPDVRDVRKFLREFLSDPMVLDMHPLARWLLLNLVILPMRPARSSRAYRSIWTDAGSPLIINCRAFTGELRRSLGDEFSVTMAMRYGRPSINSALASLVGSGARRIIALPMFPQYASSTTGSCEEAVRAEIENLSDPPDLVIIPPFYEDPGYLAAVASSTAVEINDKSPDHILFSFHGLPESHILKAKTAGSPCLATHDCCDVHTDANRHCYRAQCFRTAELISEYLELDMKSWSISFQSRLGRGKWIEPYTSDRISALAHEGVRRLAVVCPSFVCDCLETLEEIGIAAAAEFSRQGGGTLHLVPSLNDHGAWVEAAADLVRRFSRETRS